mmetsp:Transcript_4945/g.6522  ORF Transcript_4945/g.6522 Transcript_4945/m.6522 type:complete len:185 (-) Transcript_4945:456-1010(-)
MDETRFCNDCGTSLVNGLGEIHVKKEGEDTKVRAAALETEEKIAPTARARMKKIPPSENSMSKGKAMAADSNRKRKGAVGLEPDGNRRQTSALSNYFLKSSPLSIKATFESSSNVNVIEGDLLASRKAVDDGKELIVHQTNCITQRGKGLAKAIFSQYPSANCYKKRRKRGARADIPGTIQHVK